MTAPRRILVTLSERQAQALVLAIYTTTPTTRGRVRRVLLSAHVKLANALREVAK